MWLSRGRRAAGLCAALAFGLMAWTGAVLTWRYLPDGGSLRFGLPALAPVQWSRRLVHWHDVSFYLAVVASLVWCGLTMANRARPVQRAAVVVGSTLAMLALVAATAVAWHRVRWQQLALWAVTVGDDVSGLWYAAFSDQVRFVYVDGSGEVPPSELAPWVVLHLVAPFVALAALALGWLVGGPSRGPRRSIVPADVEPAGT